MRWLFIDYKGCMVLRKKREILFVVHIYFYTFASERQSDDRCRLDERESGVNPEQFLLL